MITLMRNLDKFTATMFNNNIIIYFLLQSYCQAFFFCQTLPLWVEGNARSFFKWRSAGMIESFHFPRLFTYENQRTHFHLILLTIPKLKNAFCWTEKRMIHALSRGINKKWNKRIQDLISSRQFLFRRRESLLHTLVVWISVTKLDFFFIMNGFWTIFSIFIVIFTKFQPIYPPDFYRGFSNSGT